MADTVHADASTERLWLRRWERGHAAGLAPVNADVEVMEFLNGGTPLTRVESGFVSDRVLEHWRTYGFGLWALLEKEGERMVGFAGLCHPLWFPAYAGAVEVGWRLRRDAWGLGYAPRPAVRRCGSGSRSAACARSSRSSTPRTRGRPGWRGGSA